MFRSNLIMALLCCTILASCNDSSSSGDSSEGIFSDQADTPGAPSVAPPSKVTIVRPPAPIPYAPAPFSLSNLGKDIYNGVFTGNGLLGTMTYLSSNNASTLRIDVGRTDLFDHRAKKGVMIYPDPLFLTTRLPLGHFELDFGSAISTSSGLINLYDGNATATITTQAGQQYSIRTRTLADEDMIAIEIEGPAVGAPTVKLTWVMEASKSSRTPTPTGYVANPSAIFTLSNGNSIYTVPMTAGGSYGLGYKSATAANKTTIIASTFYSKQNMGAASQIAEALNAFDVARLDAKVETHEAHWHQYYTKSAYRMPDASLQSFYDMQLYKFACTARENGPPIDLQGPWTVNNTPWPGYWSNLNTELTYSPLYTANHLEIAQTLINAIDRNKINLTLNVPQQYQSDSAGIGRAYGADMISPVLLEPDTDGKLGNNTSQAELGNLTWILFYYYQHYRYSMDKAIGSNLFDILKKVSNTKFIS